MNEEIRAWLEVARDEIATLLDYQAKLDAVQDKAKLREIMGDEVNHAVIGLLSATLLLGLQVPDDGIEELLAAVWGGEDGN